MHNKKDLQNFVLCKSAKYVKILFGGHINLFCSCFSELIIITVTPFSVRFRKIIDRLLQHNNYAVNGVIHIVASRANILMFCKNLKFLFRLLVNYLPQTPTKSKRKFYNFFSSYASPKLNKKRQPQGFLCP